MNYIKSTDESLLKKTYLPNYREIVTFKGVYNCYPVKSGNVAITFPGDNENVDIVISPKYLHFKEEPLGVCTDIQKSSSNIYTAGKYYTSTYPEILIENPQNPFTHENYFFSQYKYFLDHTYKNQVNQPNCLFFDIETVSLKGKKKIDFNKYPILAIGYAVNDRKKHIMDVKPLIEQQGIDIKSIKDPINDPYLLSAERKILIDFFNLVETANIDILVGFNSISFDLTYIIFRAYKVHKLPTDIILKMFRFNIDSNKDIEQILKGFVSTRNKNQLQKTQLYGRNHIDIWKQWYGLNDALKPTCIKLGFIEDALDVDASQMWYEYVNNYDEVIKYLFLDIDLTRELFIVNFTRIKTTLENMNCGISLMCRKTATTISSQIFANSFFEKNIVSSHNSTETNAFFLLQASSYYNLSSSVKYSGAITGIESIGRFDKVVKFDVASYYPNTIISYDLGITNTQTVGLRPFSGQYKFIPKKEWCEFIIPDHNYKYDLVIRRYYMSCPVVPIVESSYQKRLKYKKLAAEAEDSGDLIKFFEYDSINNEEKVFINGMYGSYALMKGIANPSSAMLTTGMGRYALSLMMHNFKNYAKKYNKKYNPLVEIDTDGIIVCYDYALEDVNKMMNEITINTGVSVKQTIQFDRDDFAKFYCKSTKNYVFKKKEDGPYKVKGSSLQTKKHSKLENKTTKLFIDLYLEKRLSLEETLNKLEQDFDTLFENKKMFIIPKTNIKEINEYASTSIEAKLAKQYKEIHGDSPGLGTDLSYIVVDEAIKYIIAEDKNIEKLDSIYHVNKQHYLNKIKTLIVKHEEQ